MIWAHRTTIRIFRDANKELWGGFYKKRSTGGWSVIRLHQWVCPALCRLHVCLSLSNSDPPSLTSSSPLSLSLTTDSVTPLSLSLSFFYYSFTILTAFWREQPCSCSSDPAGGWEPSPPDLFLLLHPLPLSLPPTVSIHLLKLSGKPHSQL